METKEKYRALQQKIESTIQDTFDSFLAEETKIKVAWYLTQDDESIYVDYHNQQGQEIGHNSFSVNDGATLGGVIHSVINIIEQNNNWEIKKRKWYQKALSTYHLILIPKQFHSNITKKRETIWDKIGQSLSKKRGKQ